jgi:SAM-dependent methyltransferase
VDVDKYSEMSQIEGHHWWFTGRRFLLHSVLEDLQLDENTTILDIGCGTGGNLSMLQQFGTVYGAEMDDFSRDYARQTTGVEVEYGKLPDNIPFAEKQFDLICLFDVLEHIEYDIDAMAALTSRLKEGGQIILTVPATKWLYGDHDKMFHHFRRYSLPEINEKILDSGLNPLEVSYFNTLLFPLAVLARLLDMISFGGNSTGMNTPPQYINKLLYKIFISEKRILKKSWFPFGLSLIAIANVRSS